MDYLKVTNNAGKVIEVTQAAWDLLYSKRDGFKPYQEKKQTTQKKTTTTKKTTSSTQKKVKEDESTKSK